MKKERSPAPNFDEAASRRTLKVGGSGEKLAFARRQCSTTLQRRVGAGGGVGSLSTVEQGNGGEEEDRTSLGDRLSSLAGGLIGSF